MHEIRYKLACIRLAAISDPMMWTGRDLDDVFALVSPAVPFPEWMSRTGAQPMTAPLQTPEDDSADALAALIEGRSGGDLAAIGCLTIEEHKAE